MTQHRRIPLIAGNWKMNGSLAEAESLAESLWALVMHGRRDDIEIAVCPPFVHLGVVKKHLGNTIRLGAQDCSPHASGAWTGDISAAMLQELECDFVIVGHSERRQYHHEGDAMVRQKAAAVQAKGMIPVVCVGETLAERKANKVFDVLRAQVQGSVPEGSKPSTLVLAYEPVWAIGTGEVATPAQVAEAHALIRATLAGISSALINTRILYGGSVKPDNARGLLSLDDVDGALVGGASLQADAFWEIATACS